MAKAYYKGKNIEVSRIQHSAFSIQNKIRGVFNLYFLFFIFILFTLHCSLFTHHAEGAEVVGKITYVEGTVNILREGVLAAIPVKVQDQVVLKDIIRTKSNSRAEITFNDGTIVRIAQRSRIDISEYFTDKASSKGIIKLPRGKVQAIVNKEVAQRISLSPEANYFEIHTPNAVAGVRGTNFFVSFDINTSIVLVKDGNVISYNVNFPALIVTMPPGYIATVTGDKVPEQPRPATETEINRFEREIAPTIWTGAAASLVQEPALTPLSITASKAPSNITHILVTQEPALTPLLPAFTEVLSNITGIPVTQPITEILPEIITPKPQFESSIGGSIYSAYPATSDGSFSTTMQGTATLWTATQEKLAAAKISGTYSPKSSLPHIWYNSDVYSINSSSDTKITYDGGAYRGFINGREISNTSESKFISLYIDPSGGTGFLKGDFSGTVSGSSIAMNGNSYPVQISTSSVSPSDFYNSISPISFQVSGSGTFNGSGSISITSGTTQLMNENGWGISQMLLGGTYSGTTNDIWSLSISGSSGDLQINGDANGNKWSNNKIDASAAGYWADARTTAPVTGIYVGEGLGTFNPANYTWQATSMGIWLETNKFLQMASDVNGRNKLQQLNIPAFEIGRTNLSGSLIAGPVSSYDHVSVLMNDVIFFAPSTGQKPGIWATNSISGQYDFSHGYFTPTNITTIDNVIPMSNGSEITADFQFTRWNTTNNTWVSTISNGTGNLSGGSYTGAVNFNGAGAGTITGTTNSGTISGTGAGVAK